MPNTRSSGKKPKKEQSRFADHNYTYKTVVQKKNSFHLDAEGSKSVGAKPQQVSLEAFGFKKKPVSDSCIVKSKSRRKSSPPRHQKEVQKEEHVYPAKKPKLLPEPMIARGSPVPRPSLTHRKGSYVKLDSDTSSLSPPPTDMLLSTPTPPSKSSSLSPLSSRTSSPAPRTTTPHDTPRAIHNQDRTPTVILTPRPRRINLIAENAVPPNSPQGGNQSPTKPPDIKQKDAMPPPLGPATPKRKRVLEVPSSHTPHVSPISPIRPEEYERLRRFLRSPLENRHVGLAKSTLGKAVIASSQWWENIESLSTQPTQMEQQQTPKRATGGLGGCGVKCVSDDSTTSNGGPNVPENSDIVGDDDEEGGDVVQDQPFRTGPLFSSQGPKTSLSRSNTTEFAMPSKFKPTSQRESVPRPKLSRTRCAAPPIQPLHSVAEQLEQGSDTFPTQLIDERRPSAVQTEESQVLPAILQRTDTVESTGTTRPPWEWSTPPGHSRKKTPALHRFPTESSDLSESGMPVFASPTKLRRTSNAAQETQYDVENAPQYDWWDKVDANQIGGGKKAGENPEPSGGDTSNHTTPKAAKNSSRKVNIPKKTTPKKVAHQFDDDDDEVSLVRLSQLLPDTLMASFPMPNSSWSTMPNWYLDQDEEGEQENAPAGNVNDRDDDDDGEDDDDEL